MIPAAIPRCIAESISFSFQTQWKNLSPPSAVAKGYGEISPKEIKTSLPLAHFPCKKVYQSYII
jgi:hypothetical protein